MEKPVIFDDEIQLEQLKFQNQLKESETIDYTFTTVSGGGGGGGGGGGH